jgi:hypothetical protein
MSEEALKTRIEHLERAFDEQSAENMYTRCYGVIGAVLTMLMFLPYTDNGRDNAWAVPRGSDTVEYAGTFSLMLLILLLFLVVCATVRPGKSPWLGWVIGGLALVVCVLNWIVTAHLRYPSATAYALIVVPFLVAILGTVHGLYRLRQSGSESVTNV